MGFLPILLPFLEAVTGKRINPGGPKRPFQKTDEFGGQRPKKKTDKCAPKPDFPGRPPCVYSGVLSSSAHSERPLAAPAADHRRHKANHRQFEAVGKMRPSPPIQRL